MLFSLIKANIRKQKNNLNTPFVVKSKFINLELRKCAVFTDFRVDYVPLIKSQTSYQSLIRAWYLVLATRSVQVPLIAGKMELCFLIDVQSCLRNISIPMTSRYIKTFMKL